MSRAEKPEMDDATRDKAEREMLLAAFDILQRVDTSSEYDGQAFRFAVLDAAAEIQNTISDYFNNYSGRGSNFPWEGPTILATAVFCISSGVSRKVVTEISPRCIGGAIIDEYANVAAAMEMLRMGQAMVSDGDWLSLCGHKALKE